MAPKVFFLFSFILILLLVQCHAKLPSFSGDQKTSPYEFIRALQGSQKGAKVKGINELKKYLHHFGYLSDSYNNFQTNGPDEDNFDDVLESAIKTYQVNYNLNASGTLDPETISMMMLPRCGVPDIVNGETWMRSGKGKTRQDHHGQNNKVHMLSHYKLFNNREKWSSYQLTYGYRTNASSVLIDTIMGRSFDKWRRVKPRFSFSLVNDVNIANITIGLFTGDHGDISPFRGHNSPLAHAFPPPDGRLHFNADSDFAYRPPLGNEFHFESVAVHELGHILGLNHSSDPAAVMFPTIGPGKIKVALTADDIAGINDLYP